MGKGVTEVFPHKLNLGPGLCGTPSASRKEVLERGRQAKAGAVRDVDGGKDGKELRLTDGVPSMQLSKRRLNQVLQKRQRPAVHSLVQRFGRHVDGLGQLRGFGR